MIDSDHKSHVELLLLGDPSRCRCVEHAWVCVFRHRWNGRGNNRARASVCSKQNSQTAFCHGNSCYEDQDKFAVDGKRLKPERLCGRSPLFELA